MFVGTSGHVDHGKTSLVKALTGIDTDRLPEEKRRGITLELGFAHLALPSGRTVGVIDVPGHERFVKAMAAGAGGVDVALLVVAADEGVMPQTREHVDICSLLGVRRGVLVITKSDLLPGLGEGWLELLEADLRSLVIGTPFERAALIPVSAKSGEGLDALRAELDSQVTALALEPELTRGADAPVFLPIDRAFTSKGFGLVVTGTLWSGRLTTEDAVSLLPGLPGPLRVRGLQVHGASVTAATAGNRVAVNLPELEVAQVRRGLVLTRAGELPEAKVLDVELTLLPSVEAPLGRRSRQQLTLGTEQVEAVVRLVDVDALRPGEKCFAQLRFSAPVAAIPGQRFILRGTRAIEGRGATVAGGRVLLVNPPRRRAGAAARLARFAEAPLEERLQLLLTEAGYGGLDEAGLFARAQSTQKEVTRALERASARGAVVLVERERSRSGGTPAQPGPERSEDLGQGEATRKLERSRSGGTPDQPGPQRSEDLGQGGATRKGERSRSGGTPDQPGPQRSEDLGQGEATRKRDARRFVAAEVLKALEARALARLDAFHLASAERAGMPREELRQRLGEPPERVFARVVQGLLEGRKVELIDELLRLPGRGRAFTEAASAHQAQLAALLEARGLSPPTFTELESALRLPPARVLELGQSLVSAGRAVRAGELFFAKSAIGALHQKLLAHFATHEKLSTQAFKELTGLSRKFLIPLAEYFDREKVTLRVGDERLLRKPGRS
ncbi:MAG: selenocysteine-specific translation elongation factor [Archangium sp.]|nr:selenocysteine-specific translation elongation factor [Archangium sp.]